jgi:uncharacterized DUF497 family protein
MKFEWDDKKNAANIRKHKVSFEQAIGVFSDLSHVERYDAKHSSVTETRFNAVGFVKNNHALFVAFTEPAPDTRRIISARKAENHEVKDFYGNR